MQERWKQFSADMSKEYQLLVQMHKTLQEFKPPSQKSDPSFYDAPFSRKNAAAGAVGSSGSVIRDERTPKQRVGGGGVVKKQMSPG